jgi:DNA-binding response OmpR family regulator
MRLLVVEDDLRLCDVLHRGLGEQGHVVDNTGTTDANSLQQGTEEFGLPAQQFWLTLTQKI